MSDNLQLARLEPTLPRIPDFSVDIREHGARPDSGQLITEAIAAAIDACCRQGGGRVIVPAGEWSTGPIHLRDHVELHLEDGAMVRFSQNPDDYLPVVLMQRGGIRCYGYSPFIYACNAHDIAITGAGVFDGQGHSWWPWKHAQPGMVELFRANAARLPVRQRVYDTVEQGVRPPMLQFLESHTILIEGVTFQNSPSWTVHPVCCREMTLRDLTVNNPWNAHNTDGIDPDSCSRVLIERCEVDTGDDGICLKSGRDADGRELARPCEDVLIRHCTVRRAHGGVVIGSEMSGGVRNVLAHDCVFDGADVGVRLKTRPERGGFVRGIRIEGMVMRNIQHEAIVITTAYGGEKIDIPDKAFADVPEIDGIHIGRLHCESAGAAALIKGMPRCRPGRIVLEDLDISAVRGFTCEHVDDLRMDRVLIRLGDNQPAPMPREPRLPCCTKAAGQTT